MSDERITTQREAGGYIVAYCECGWGSDGHRTSMRWPGSKAQRDMKRAVERHLDECPVIPDRSER